MGTITLSESTHERLRLVAATLGRSEAEAVDHLLNRLARSGRSESEASPEVPIYFSYGDHRIEGLFDTSTAGVKITSGERAGTSWKSPSRAAIEVVRSIKPSVNPNRNGWYVWTVLETGQPLQSLRRK